jgi:formyltetrahydrofolate deformylase
MESQVLLIDCPDQPGLVHAITGVLFRAGFNIISNHEFVDVSSRHFFMRTAFAAAAVPEALLPELRQLLPANARIRLFGLGKRPVVLMATKEAHCLGDLLLRYAYGDLPIQVLAVISNYDTLAPLVEQFNLPFHYISHQGLERAAHEQAVIAVLERYAFDYLVLAKYMRVLTPAFVERYPERIINIHHSFLPAFIGSNPYRQAFERGVKMIGATAHVVNNDLDDGPIIAQGVLPITHSSNPADLVIAGRDVEKTVLARGLKLVLEERVFIHKNRTVVFE